MKKIFRIIKEQWIWLTSKKVLEAINDGATYEEVEKIVQEEVQRW